MVILEDLTTDDECLNVRLWGMCFHLGRHSSAVRRDGQSPVFEPPSGSAGSAVLRAGGASSSKVEEAVAVEDDPRREPDDAAGAQPKQRRAGRRSACRRARGRSRASRGCRGRPRPRRGRCARPPAREDDRRPSAAVRARARLAAHDFQVQPALRAADAVDRVEQERQRTGLALAGQRRPGSARGRSGTRPSPGPSPPRSRAGDCLSGSSPSWSGRR